MSEAPFALTMKGDVSLALERIVAWLTRTTQPRAAMWVIEDLEANREAIANIGDVVSTHDLLGILNAQIIEIDLVAYRGGNPEWRIVVRDGATVDLLGHGEAPTPTDLEADYVLRDPRVFAWR